MRKILLLNYEFPPLGGGASPVSYELAERLSRTGDSRIDVVTMGYHDLPEYQEVNDRFRIHRVRCWRSKKEICHPWEQATYLWSGHRKAVQLHLANRYDICHAHFLIPTGVIAARLQARFGLEYVVTAHGSDVPGFNTDRFRLLHRFTGPILRYIANRAKWIVSPSHYLAKLIFDNIHPDIEAKLKVIPNGIDVDKFTPRKKRKIILGSGRLLPRKGFQTLVEAVSNQDVGYEVHICGDGPMMAKLKALQQESRTRVVLHGWMDNASSEYRELLESADIFVLASHKENASIALLEAMSSGAAVVTTNVSGCPETVGPDGLLIEPGDVAGLREMILKLITQTEFRIELQTVMRQRVLEHFSWERVLDHYSSVLS